MGTTQRREREKTEFREEVLKAARAIVLAEGFGALSMRKIAEAIDYSPGTIYLYFESRDDIAHELVHRGFRELVGALAPAAELPDPRARLFDLGDRYVKFGLENPETYRLLFMEDPTFSAAWFDLHGTQESPGDQALGFLEACFDDLRAQKRLLSDAPSAVLAETLWAAVHGIVSLKLLCHDHPQTPAAQLYEVMGAALLNGLVKPFPAAGRR